MGISFFNIEGDEAGIIIIFVFRSEADHVFVACGSEYADDAVKDFEIHLIYETFLKQFRLKAGDCFFIDDLPENIEGAKDVGMGGFCYTPGRTDELRKILELPH